MQRDLLVTHGLLFVGTKLLANTTRNNAPELDPSDLLLLINDFTATFHPVEREFVEMDLPVADYSQISLDDDPPAPEPDENQTKPTQLPTNDQTIPAEEESSLAESQEVLPGGGEHDDELMVRVRKEGEASFLNEKVCELLCAQLRKKLLSHSIDASNLQGSFNSNFTHHREDKDNNNDNNANNNNNNSDDEENIENNSKSQVEIQQDEQDEDDSETLQRKNIIKKFVNLVDKEAIRIGSSGEEVKLLQEMLGMLGFFSGQKNGNFEQETELAVQHFQGQAELPDTGVANFVTVRAMAEKTLKYFQTHDLKSATVTSFGTQKQNQNGSNHNIKVLVNGNGMGDTQANGEVNGDGKAKKAREKKDGNFGFHSTDLEDDDAFLLGGNDQLALPQKAEDMRGSWPPPKLKRDSAELDPGLKSNPSSLSTSTTLTNTSTSTAIATATAAISSSTPASTSTSSAFPSSATNTRDSWGGLASGESPFPEFSLKRPFDLPTSTAYKMVYLRFGRYAPRWVYYAELAQMTTLVLITNDHPTKGAKGDQKERARLDLIRDRMQLVIKNYAFYLVTKEHAHFPVLSFLHQFPGLVHFIFVDRTYNRVIAPSITAVHGLECSLTPEQELHIKLIIKNKVWDMCYKVQQCLAEGHYSMSMKSGGFQYSYRLWIEDTEGFELSFGPEQRFPYTGGPQNYKFYKKLVEQTFPSRTGLRCYELYTLYLGALGLHTVTHYDKCLVSILLDRKNK